VRADAALHIDAGGRIGRVVSAPPVTFRAAGGAVYVVGTAAGPLGEDDVRVQVRVAAGGELRLRSAAATIVYAGRSSRQAFDIAVGPGASLDWRPEPLIATTGCHHLQDVSVSLAEGASVDWTEEVVLGRHGEAPGEVELRLSVDSGGRPLLRHHLVVGRPGWDGPAVLGAARATGLRLLAGPGVSPAGSGGPGDVGLGWAWMDLDGPGRLLVAFGADLAQMRERMAAAAVAR
jgi:urease accessory protein